MPLRTLIKPLQNTTANNLHETEHARRHRQGPGRHRAPSVASLRRQPPSLATAEHHNELHHLTYMPKP